MNFVLLSRAKWIETHPAVVERFLKAMVQAEYFVKNNAMETKKFLEQRFKYEPAYVQNSWYKHDFVVTLPQALLITMEDEAEWRIENHLTDQAKIPNYLNFIYLDGLKRVKPNAISIIH